MHVFKTIAELRHYLDAQQDLRIGFTPTMGALHVGHISLLKQSEEETDLSVVSIFVNPTQFNDPKDLEKYPRTLDHDLEMLQDGRCDVVFVPDVEEIYPADAPDFRIDFNGLDRRMEGHFRPGHFKGVAQVVKRLLDIVEPDRLYMGQKDFQQVAVIRHLINVFQLPVQLVMCDTMREANGLAMSSRNLRLSADIKERASVIYKTLNYCAGHIDDMAVKDLEVTAMKRLTVPGFRPEYFEIVDGFTLQRADEETEYIVACCAVWADDVRLIDNMILRG